jgi:Family of unknown function (DUF6174)
MRRRYQIGLLLLLLSSCKDHGLQPLPPDPYEKWRSYNFHNYSIDQMRVCYCPEGGQRVRIRVRSDTVASVIRLFDSSVVTTPALRYYLTVDSLFAIIRGSTADSLGIRYNEVYGYPESLDINPQLHPVDGGVLYMTSNLRNP